MMINTRNEPNELGDVVDFQLNFVNIIILLLNNVASHVYNCFTCVYMCTVYSVKATGSKTARKKQNDDYAGRYYWLI